MPGKEYGIALALFVKLQYREPYPSGQPDREPMNALLHILGGGGCYVDVALWGGLTTSVC